VLEKYKNRSNIPPTIYVLNIRTIARILPISVLHIDASILHVDA